MLSDTLPAGTLTRLPLEIRQQICAYAFDDVEPLYKPRDYARESDAVNPLAICPICEYRFPTCTNGDYRANTIHTPSELSHWLLATACGSGHGVGRIMLVRSMHRVEIVVPGEEDLGRWKGAEIRDVSSAWINSLRRGCSAGVTQIHVDVSSGNFKWKENQAMEGGELARIFVRLSAMLRMKSEGRADMFVCGAATIREKEFMELQIVGRHVPDRTRQLGYRIGV